MLQQVLGMNDQITLLITWWPRRLRILKSCSRTIKLLIARCSTQFPSKVAPILWFWFSAIVGRQGLFVYYY